MDKAIFTNSIIDNKNYEKPIPIPLIKIEKAHTDKTHTDKGHTEKAHTEKSRFLDKY